MAIIGKPSHKKILGIPFFYPFGEFCFLLHLSKKLSSDLLWSEGTAGCFPGFFSCQHAQPMNCEPWILHSLNPSWLVANAVGTAFCGTSWNWFGWREVGWCGGVKFLFLRSCCYAFSNLQHALAVRLLTLSNNFWHSLDATFLICSSMF